MLVRVKFRFTGGNIAIQGKKRFIAHHEGYHYQPGDGMNANIPPGIEETGAINFEPLDPTQHDASFRFRVKTGPSDYEFFMFTIDINT